MIFLFNGDRGIPFALWMVVVLEIVVVLYASEMFAISKIRLVVVGGLDLAS